MDVDTASDVGAQEQEYADDSPIRSETVSGFIPLPAKVKYLSALEEAVPQGRPHSDTALCATLGISRTPYGKWRQNHKFNGCLRWRMDETSDDSWPLVLRRHELLAIQGSVRSAEVIAKIRAGAYWAGERNCRDRARSQAEVHRASSGSSPRRCGQQHPAAP